MNASHDDVDLDPNAAVEAWRAQGAARSHAVAFTIVQALARRAAAQQGEARRLMLQRVVQLIDAHRATNLSTLAAASTPDRPDPRQAALAGLSALVDRLGRTPLQRHALRPNDAPAPPNAVTAFKGTWSRLRADQRLRQAFSQVPAMAGPLNSSNVVNRTLQTMRELSPEYLDAFMAQVDTLLWLERASGGGGAEPAPRAAASKDARRVPRKPGANAPERPV